MTYHKSICIVLGIVPSNLVEVLFSDAFVLVQEFAVVFSKILKSFAAKVPGDDVNFQPIIAHLGGLEKN